MTFPDGPHESGSRVELLAIPGKEYLFKEWSGDASGSANPLTVSMNADKKVIALFERKNYELEITTEGEGTVKEEIVEDARLTASYPHGTLVRLTAQPEEGWFFEKWEGDVSGTNNPVELTVDQPASVKAVFKEDKPVDLYLEDAKRVLFISESYKVRVKVLYASGKEETVDNSELTLSSIGGVGKIVISGDTVLAVEAGATGFIAFFRGFSKVIVVTVSPVEEVKDYDPSLMTPAAGATVVVPVVVINYLPTLDGINLDMNRAPDDFYVLRYSTLEEARKRIEGELKITKSGIEEGTRFRQFNSSQRVAPYAGIRVVKYFNVYDMKMTAWEGYGTTKTPDYRDLFPRLGMEDLVNNQGVKEVWITMFNKDSFPSVRESHFNDPLTYYGIPESNMSSPLTGDISNSYRDPNDLPVYQKTYVVYGNSGHRGADTNLHNRGHQIEAQLHYIEAMQGLTTEDDRLFWNRFVGIDKRLGDTKPLGRAGMTHFPPNTTIDYDYDNPALVDSDIRTWDPEGGEFVKVNNSLWKGVDYDFNMVNTFYMNGRQYQTNYTRDPHTKWLIYWWQSIPGKENGLSFRGDPLTNWWDVFYNWDDIVRASGGLVKNSSAGSRYGGGLKTDRQFPVCTHPMSTWRD